MQFIVIPNSGSFPETGNSIAYLWEDNWNDWYKYKTLYVLSIFDEKGQNHWIGPVKIGQFGMSAGQLRPHVPSKFDFMDQNFFSLGQDEAYYSNLRSLGEEAAKRILNDLNDIAYRTELLQPALEEDVTGESLMRYVALNSLKGQFRRIIEGGAALTDYKFTYTTPSLHNGIATNPITLSFDVTPDSKPPTNIHVLVGRNGVGKTFMFHNMINALTDPETNPESDGSFSSSLFNPFDPANLPFANFVSVTFSAFDKFKEIKQSHNFSKRAKYTYVGLRQRIKDKNNQWVTITRDPSDLAKEFATSAKACLIGDKLGRWQKALETLQADPLFHDACVAELADADDVDFNANATKLFDNLSSGHKVVLLTITKLVENVEEGSLVLVDEPETHLHPPLLSAFIRALSDLLINRNGVAIIATHSPVVLQEVPSSCVWKIIRHGLTSRVDRPSIQTFAENVGVLTREIFGLEVTRSGFHKMLIDASEQNDDFNSAASIFDDELGSEGRALLMGIIASRQQQE